MHKRAIVYGITGFIGSGLAEMLKAEGYAVTGVSRTQTDAKNSHPAVDSWTTPEAADLSGSDLVINLAGAPIDKRWTEKYQQELYDSRVLVTQEIIGKITKLPAADRPATLINGSAVGIYGARGDELLNRSSLPGSGYLASLCKSWENAAEAAVSLGVRVVLLRTGIVLGEGGAAYEKLLKVFKAGIGGKLGDGKQYMPWIHVKDLRRIIIFAASNLEISGAVNGTAPQPETNKDFTQKLANSLSRWAILPVPGFALKAVLGGFGGALLVGQRAVPDFLQTRGFTFDYPCLEDALEDLTKSA